MQDTKVAACAPWYVDIDLHWYVQKHDDRYQKAVATAKEIERFVAYAGSDMTAFAEETATRIGVSLRTLYRYAESYLEAENWAHQLEQEEGRSFDYLKPLSLCRKPKESHTFPSITPEQRAYIENVWFDKGFAANLGSVEMLYSKFEQAAAEKGWATYPSYATVARYVRYLMEELRGESARFLAANGEREWKNKRMLKGKRDTRSLAVMEFVQGDEHTFDCWVQVSYDNGKIRAVRPKLVAWIDTRTRCITGDVVCVVANAQVLKESVVKMVYGYPGGVPKHIHIDNGKDYTAQTNLGQSRKVRGQELVFDSEAKGFYRSIGIEEWSRSLPYQPWGKGQIERFFGTVCTMFTKWLDSYTGTLTGSQTSSKRKKDIDGMLERGELLTMEEFFELWTKWKDEVYHQREHGGLKANGEAYTKPIELFEHAAERYEKAPPPREFAAMLLMKADTALVHNQGIIKWNKLYTDYALANYIDKTVLIRWDIDDVTKLYVYTRDGRKICEAHSAEVIQIAPRVSQKALAKLLQNQKRQRKEVREALEGFRTPFEVRVESDSDTPAMVGGLDLTIHADRPAKVVALPDDKQFREETRTKCDKKSSTEFLNRKGAAALSKLREIG